MSQQTAREEWRENWKLVAAAMLGISFSVVPLMTIGLFMDPLSEEFGWSRTQISYGLLIFAIAAVPLSPLVGALVDRLGARRIAILGIVLSALTFSAFSLLHGSIVEWLVFWTVLAIVSLLARGTVWMTAVSGVFDKGRGLAMSLVLSGTAIASAGGPIVAQQLVDNLGWRHAYIGLGLGWPAVALLLIVPFFHDKRARENKGKSAAQRAQSLAQVPGLTFKEALRNQAVLKIAFVNFMVIFTLASISVHTVPIMTDRGISRETAALLSGLTAITLIGSKLVMGALLDRWSNPWLFAVGAGFNALSYGVFSVAGDSVLLNGLAVLLIGCGSGFFLPLNTYLISRYAGLRNFGTILGAVSSLSAIAAGVGPLAAAMVFENLGNYQPLMTAYVPLLLVTGLVIRTVGKAPDFAQAAAPSN